MTGAKFWGAFFFELPFVLIRTVPVALLLAMGIAYAVWEGKAKIFNTRHDSNILTYPDIIADRCEYPLPSTF